MKFLIRGQSRYLFFNQFNVKWWNKKNISILKTCQSKKIAIKKQGLNLIGNKKLKKKMKLKENFNFIKYFK